MEYSTSTHQRPYEVESCWEEIGIQLEIDDQELEDIRRRCTSKTQGCDNTRAFKDTIRIWVKQDKPPPTWPGFVEALERLKIFPHFVNYLRSKYCMWSTMDDL